MLFNSVDCGAFLLKCFLLFMVLYCLGFVYLWCWLSCLFVFIVGIVNFDRCVVFGLVWFVLLY